MLPELEDLEKTLREEYNFETDIFAIPSENSHLELMLRIGEIIKKHEGQDTLFVIYYGGHAKIDESRQSTWCAYVAPSSLLPPQLCEQITHASAELGTLLPLGCSGPPFRHCLRDRPRMY